jgi:hypothetical protein
MQRGPLPRCFFDGLRRLPKGVAGAVKWEWRYVGHSSFERTSVPCRTIDDAPERPIARRVPGLPFGPTLFASVPAPATQDTAPDQAVCAKFGGFSENSGSTRRLPADIERGWLARSSERDPVGINPTAR